VTTLWIERFSSAVAPTSGIRTHDDRVVAFARELTRDALAERRVWCAAALSSGVREADALRARLATPVDDEPGTHANPLRLDVRDDALLRDVAQQLDAMLHGTPANARLGAAARAALAEQADAGEPRFADDVAEGDVVVLHDALTAVLAQAVRDRGAHAVWLVDAGRSDRPAAREAFEFLARFTRGVDAYVVAWSERAGAGRRLEHVAALMPHSGVVELKEVVVGGRMPPGLGWSSALANVVVEDRHEHVGGRLHPRPAVAAR